MLACLTALLFAVRAQGAPPVTVDDIIAQVQRNERLYENIDARLIATQTSLLTPMFADPNIKVSQSSEAKVRFVGQDGMFRAEATEVFTMLDGAKRTSVTARVFDSHTTKSLITAREGSPGNVNLIKGRADDHQIVRPHMMLMRLKQTVPPFSAFLRGADAVRAYPYGQFSESIDLTVEYQGPAERNGLRCQVVVLTHTVKKTGAPNFRAVLWLAEDRNYIPIRREAYDYLFSGEVPVSEGEVSEWRELKPGVWFPYLTEVRRYNDDDVKKHKLKTLSGTWKYQFENVSLEPKFEPTFFQDLAIPAGSAVYEVEDKKIIRSYRGGEK
jgi:hypothetical protein